MPISFNWFKKTPVTEVQVEEAGGKQFVCLCTIKSLSTGSEP